MPHVDVPARAPLFEEARQSVLDQERPADQFLIAHDPAHTGAGVTMNRGLGRVSSEWVAQLGDDDYFLPWHLRALEPYLVEGVRRGLPRLPHPGGIQRAPGR